MEEDQIRKAVSTPASRPSRGTVIITPDTCREFKANGVMLQERREIKDRLPDVSTAETQTAAGQKQPGKSCVTAALRLARSLLGGQINFITF